MKRLLNVFAVFTLAIMITAAFSVPEKALAGGTKNKPAVDGEVITYNKTDGKKGIKRFTINPYTYYNICENGKLTEVQLQKIAEEQIFPRWGVIAEGIFRDQASQLVTIEGSGMMKSDKNASESFDRHFSHGKKNVNSGYSSYNWSVSDLADWLGHTRTSGKSGAELGGFYVMKGKTNEDEVVSTGIQPINNLNDARTRMGESLRACADDNDLTVDDFLGNSKDKSGNEYRLPAIADDKTQDGFVNIVTCNNRAGSSGDYDYVSFGIAVYDFDVTPIAANGLNYITEADNYIEEDNPIKAAKAAMPDSKIQYSEGNNSTYSLMRNESPQDATTTTTLESTTTEETNITTEESFEWGMEQEIGVEVQWGGDDAIGFAPSKVAVHANQGWHETWGTMKSEGKTWSKTTGKNISTEMPLPGHTGAVVIHNTENKNWTLPYGQPVALSYKVAIFAMSGDYYNGWGGMISASRYDKEWMSVLFDGSDTTETSGCNALTSLYNRAVRNADTESYDGVKGKYRTWCDKGAWKESRKINWNNVASELTDANETRSTHSIPNAQGTKSSLTDLATNIPMAEIAANLNDNSTAITATIKEFLALYPLDNVAIEKGSRTYDLTNGSRMYLDGIELEGYDEDNVSFFGFDQGWGQWELQGEGVEEDKDSDGNDIQILEKDGGKVTLTTLQSGSQRLEVTGYDNIMEDKYVNLKWKLDEDEYKNIRWNEHTNGATQAEAEKVKTPTVTINVLSQTKDIKSLNVSGTYEGPYDESVNLSKELDVEAKDENGANLSVPIFWEDNSTEDGHRYVSENGDTKFSQPGEYKVRAYTMNGSKKIISGWITVKAKEKADLTKIEIVKPDLDEADLTLTKEFPVRAFDLNSYLKYTDQFGNDWKGTEDNPLPVVEFSVDQIKGPDGTPEVDRDGIFTVLGPGTYEISAEVSANEKRDVYKNIKIAPVRIVITQEDWLNEITMTDPSIDKNELNLKNTKMPVTINNLKQYLEFYDQQGEEWEGKKPVVKFAISGETDGAEIKGSNSTGYDFYAYSPGRYTIQPSASGYDINPIYINVGEDRELTIKTNDPPELVLSREVGSVSVDLARFVDYTTQFGGKWTGNEPVLDFKLDASVTGARIENGEIAEFSADKAGRYYVHVTPRKASEYEKEIDDIVIDVTKKKEIYFVALDFDGLSMGDRTIGEDGKYTLAGLSKYLTYADEEFEGFTEKEIANYRYQMPKITGYTVSKVDEDGNEQTGVEEATWKIIEADGDYTFETQEPGIYMIIPTLEGKSNEPPFGLGNGIVVLPEGMNETFSDMIEQIAAIIADDYSGYDDESKEALAKFEKFIKDIPNLSGDQAIKHGDDLIKELIAESPKTKAIKELEEYKDPKAYRAEQKQELEEVIAAGTESIKSAKGKEAVTAALSAAKAAIDAIETDAELTAEELAEAKTKAKEELAAYKDESKYRDAQKTELSKALNSGWEEIDAATDKDAVAAAVEKAKASIDKIKTDEEMTAEEKAAEEAEKKAVEEAEKKAKEEAEKKAAEELAAAKDEAKKELATYKDASKYRDAQKAELSDAIKAGNGEIDAAADKDAVTAAVAKVKANMDKIKTDEELTAEEKAAEQAAKEEAEKKAQEEAEKKAQEEAEKKAKEEAEKKAAEEKAANANGADGTAYGKGAGAKAVDKAITSMKSDADPKGTKIAPLLLQSKSQGKNSIKLTWKKVSGAKKYVVYGNACGKNNKMKKLATRAVNNMNVTKITKKLKAKTYHKFMVVALDKNDKVVSTSAIIHVATKGNLKKAANPKKVVVKAKVNAKGKKTNTLKALSKTVINKGKKVTLKASFTKAKNSKVKKHVAIRYMSSNTKIATVSKKGVVIGIKKGTATIYAYAQNGIYKTVKVTVK